MHQRRRMIQYDIIRCMITSTYSTSAGTRNGEDCLIESLSVELTIRRVVSLQVSPIDDTFVSASLDNTVRLWDLRTSTSRVCPILSSLSASSPLRVGPPKSSLFSSSDVRHLRNGFRGRTKQILPRAHVRREELRQAAVHLDCTQ